MARGLDEGAAVSTAWVTMVRNSSVSRSELDLASRDPGDVEQVVEQAGHVLDLPLRRSRAPDRAWRVVAVEADHLQGVTDRRQRVAELVRQHGQEFVLAAVGLRAGRRRVASSSSIRRLGDVGDDAEGTGDRLPVVGIGSTVTWSQRPPSARSSVFAAPAASIRAKSGRP